MSITSLQNLYIAYFGRAADPAGLGYWLSEEAAGVSDQTIAASFAAQAEAAALYPRLGSPTLSGSAGQADFLNAVYQNLFGHAGDPAGLSYWESALSSGVSPGQIILAIINGAQGTDTATLASKNAAATSYTSALASADPSVTFGANDVTQSRQILAGVTAGTSASVTGSAIAAAIRSDQGDNSGTSSGSPASSGGTPSSGGGTPGVSRGTLSTISGVTTTGLGGFIGVFGNSGTISGGFSGVSGNSGTIGALTSSGTISGASSIFGFSGGAGAGGSIGALTNSGSFVFATLPPPTYLYLTGGDQVIGPPRSESGFGAILAGNHGGFTPDTATASQVTSDDSINGYGELTSVLDNETTVTPALTNVTVVDLAPALATQTFSGASSQGLADVFLEDDPFGDPASDGEAALGATLTVIGIPTSVTVGMANGAPATGPQDNLIVAFTGLSSTLTNTAYLMLTGNNAGTSGDSVDFQAASNGGDVNVLNLEVPGGLIEAAPSNAVTLGDGLDTALTTVNVTGSEPLTLTNTYTSLTTYNGSAAMGDQTVTFGALSGRATIAGGSGNDTLDASAATRSVTITEGFGDDTMILNGAVASNKITAGGGEDRLEFRSASGNGGLTWVSASDLTNNILADLPQMFLTQGELQVDLHPNGTAIFNLDTSISQPALANVLANSNDVLSVLNGIANLIAGQTPAPAGGTGTGVAQVVAFGFQGNEFVFQDNHPTATTLVAGDGAMEISAPSYSFSTKDISFS